MPFAVNFKTLSAVYRWVGKLPLRLFPPTCLLCGAAGEGEWDLCAGCRADLPRNRHSCQRCALPLSGGSVCGQCLHRPPAFDRTFAPLLYQPPVDFLIKALKFQGRLVFARLLGEGLAQGLEQRGGPFPQCLIPVPLHPSRLRQRGFNQSLELARPVARRLGITLLRDHVRRIRRTTPQVELDYKARLTNVRGAFAVSRPIAARHVAIVDDVVTTGSTVAEIARVLRAAGVEEIEVWACARTAQS